MVPVLIARGLVKNYRRRRVVDRVDLTVEPGERVAVLGPNGAGKTTVLLMCLGVVRSDAGTISIAGHPVPRKRAAARANVGFAAGYLPMPDRIRVREYLTLYGRLHGLDDMAERSTAALRRFGVEHLAPAMATELSSGQKTLVGIVKATLHEPPLLVLDEPTASLDPEVANRVRTGLTQICGPGRSALLLTSHNTTEVERLADRVVFLSGGRVVANDSPSRVAAQFGSKDLEDVFLRLAESPIGIDR